MSEAALMGAVSANTSIRLTQVTGENLLMRVFPDLNLTSLDQQPYIPASAAR